MQISTKVVLNENEIKEAIIGFIGSKLDLPGDTKFNVDFEDATGGDLSAIVDIISDGADPKPKEPVKTPAKRGRKPAAATASNQEADTKSEETEETEQTEDPAEGDGADQSSQVEEPETTQQAIVAAPVTTAPKSAGIFPSASTSAPEPSKPEEVDPAVKAKSLFANLPDRLNTH